MQPSQRKPNAIVRGPIFPEPVQVLAVVPMGKSVKLIGKDLKSGRVHDPVVNEAQLTLLEATPDIQELKTRGLLQRTLIVGREALG